MTPFALALLIAGCTGDPAKDVAPDDTDSPQLRDRDSDGVLDSLDCRPDDPVVYPGAREVCDGKDNDCDGQVDGADDQVDPNSVVEYFEDFDGDGVGLTSKGKFCEPPRRGVTVGGDCDDNDALNYPGNAEVCDGQDNDCDNLVDDNDGVIDGSSATTFFADLDGDGYGNPDEQQRRCVQPPQTSRNASDCDDNQALAWSNAPERCDGVDNDCDKLVDDLDPSIDPAVQTRSYADADGDGFGDPAVWTVSCVVAVGYVVNASDCDDQDLAVNPLADEVCDGIDNDCDALGLIDDEDPNVDLTTARTWYRDADGDGYGNGAIGRPACRPAPGTVPNDFDCDDTEPLAFKGNPEVCDGVDNDCARGTDEEDPFLDESTLTTWYRDADRDGHGAPSVLAVACIQPVGGASVPDDCDDTEPRAWTGAPEVCDGVDNDCDGGTDVDPLNGSTFYQDLDGDGRGNPAVQIQACGVGNGAASAGNDCNDADPLAWTGAREVCDGSDNDCDRLLDAADPSVDLATGRNWYTDADRDGYGVGAGTFACSGPPGTAPRDGDCNDALAAVNPGATEVCDPANTDEDCDGRADDADTSVLPASRTTFYTDQDGDGWGVGQGARACDGPPSTASQFGDCNDRQPAMFPGNTEVCDALDNNCVNGADEADPALDRSTLIAWYVDVDRDGRGSPSGETLACQRPSGRVANDDDCNDAQPLAWTGNLEVCDGVDNDCQGGVDNDPVDGRLYYADDDRDGRGDPLAAQLACAAPFGFVGAAGDCNDAEARAWTGNTEVCDGVDNDCANGVDQADPNLDASTLPTWRPDRDRDGYGAGPGTVACTGPAGTVANDGDCNDNQPLAWTGKLEVCDGVDNDCDGENDADAWWNAAFPYRVMVDVAAPPSRVGQSPPVAVDVDFRALLTSLGDLTALDADNVRVVRQSCAAGLPEVPAEFVDGVAGLFDATAIDDPGNDGFGTLAFLADGDGDYTTREPLAAGSRVTYGVYFASAGVPSVEPPPAWPSELVADVRGGVGELSNGLTYASFDAALGGLADTLGPLGGADAIGAQSSNLGNGIYVSANGASARWLSARSASGTLSVVHGGPVFGMVRASGSVSAASGGFSYQYTYLMFDGRPEVYARVRMVITQPTHLGPLAPSWSASVRPWLTDNLALVDAFTGEEGTKDPGLLWSRAGYAPGTASAAGVAMGWRTAPRFLEDPVNLSNGRWVGLTGQDAADAAGLEVDLSAGTVLVDHAVMAVYPHLGPYTAVSEDFLAALAGVTATVGDVETW